MKKYTNPNYTTCCLSNWNTKKKCDDRNRHTLLKKKD